VILFEPISKPLGTLLKQATESRRLISTAVKTKGSQTHSYRAGKRSGLEEVGGVESNCSQSVQHFKGWSRETYNKLLPQAGPIGPPIREVPMHQTVRCPIATRPSSS